MAKLYFFTEARYLKAGVGIYNPSGVLKYELFKRYLGVFDEMIIVARVQIATDEELSRCIDTNRVDGVNISVAELPYFWGPLDYFKKQRCVSNSMKNIISSLSREDRCILRVPGNIGDLAAKILKKQKINYAVEVVGDPFDVFSNGASTHKLRFFLKLILSRSLKKTVKNAIGVCYITTMVLPDRYPASDKAFTDIISNVRLKENDYVDKIKPIDVAKKRLDLISIGSLEQMYKSPDIVIDAVSKLVELGHEVHLTWVGEGKFKGEMIKYASDKGVDQYISFIGYIGEKDKINKLLDDSDIFILVSRAEAQGRAIIEAMARGKIVIGSNVGGIPENVSPEFLVPKDCVDSLVDKIVEVKLLKDFSKWQYRNLNKAKEYEESLLQHKRDGFLKKILNNERENI